MNRTQLIRIVTLLAFLLMVSVNILANTLPINEVTTGQVSDSYPNLFAPAGFTFAIWGLIYLLLAGYTVYQLGYFKKSTADENTELLNNVGILFSISSVANAAWIFAWHYQQIFLALLLIVVILVCLILINQNTRNDMFSLNERLFIAIPFSVYFGWITVATIANVTTLLVSINWDGFGIAEPTWTVIIIFIGFLIGATTMLKNLDLAYGLVIIWAYSGILYRHISSEGFDGEYTSIIAITLLCIILLLISIIYIIYRRRNSNSAYNQL
ncbi:tryptophan-rich sensory protein [Methanosalsum natronophilum]|uniref:Tryptophan-rich sensory protein n=1 Tax=Methanosalsum natronophilum TaxID=768733 RepID=A0A3R7XDJ5_9EURY|nr:tryptophan-rich sensory protein [Methanosalsum natronophilum]MCS3923738.1 magnesium-transporting ATPase (P-type) [Methanosalsum natronophilum]RQD80415.1 MAG: tryptophan-rich sensory protein [Methanosalsum natronophilum]